MAAFQHGSEHAVPTALPLGVQVNSLKRISFKEMLQHYKKQPQARPDIFRSVIIEQSPNDLAVTKTGDIIEFYNAVLIPAIKNFVLECAPHPAALRPAYNMMSLSCSTVPTSCTCTGPLLAPDAVNPQRSCLPGCSWPGAAR